MEIGDRVIFVNCAENNLPLPYYGLLDVHSADPLYFVTALFLCSTGLKVSVNYSDILFDIETLKYVNAPLSPSMEKLASLCDVDYDIAKKVSATPVASSSASKHIPAIPKAAPKKVLTKFEKLVHLMGPFLNPATANMQKTLNEIQDLIHEGFSEKDFVTSGQIVTFDTLTAFAPTERAFFLEKLEFLDDAIESKNINRFLRDAVQILRRNGFYQ